LLFNRKSPCTGCRLGEKFQIQNGLQSFSVQSNHFNLNEDDDATYWIHLYEDISEQKALENKFQQTARLAELGLISSSIAHELNNPLGGIISYLQIMKIELPKDHSFQNDVDMMNQTALRMKKIIEELLIFSRKEDSLQIENVSLLEVLSKNLDLLQMQLKKENLRVSMKEPQSVITHSLSVLHFRNSIHLVFQYFLQKLKIKKLNQSNYTGLVEVKIFQDQMNSYLSFAANLGPYDMLANTHDMTLITLEKSLLDQDFQVVISESQPGWIQILITLPLTKAA
jgi:two-component system, NtrC family, sensor kinase